MTLWSVLVTVLVSRVSGQCSPTPCGIHTTCEVNAGGAAVCRCEAGWDHAPGSNTIEGGYWERSLAWKATVSTHPGQPLDHQNPIKS